MAAVGQRWKVSPEGGIAVREGREPSSQELPERLPKGAIISELECVGENLHYLRVSSEGPQTGWLSVRSASGKDLLERFVPSKRKAAETAPTQRAPAVRLAKPPTQHESRELKVSTGSQWLVIAEDSLVVRKGQRTTSQKVPECLPSGAVVEEVEVAGDRLHFLNTSGVGPSSGWVSITDKGQERLQRVAQLSDPLVSLEGVIRGFLSTTKVDLYPEGSTEEEKAEEADRPLEGWAALSKLYGRDVREVAPRPQPGAAAAAAETMGGRRRMPRQALPPVDDLENLDETALVDALGFDPMAAKEFANLPRTQKRKMIAEARALIEMGPEKRMEALDNYRRAWPKGPFPELTPAVEDTAVLPPGSCFPYSRHLREVPSGLAPEWGLEAPAGKAVRTFFQRRITSTHEAQKEFFRSLKCEVTSSSEFLSAEAGAGHPDPCAMGDLVDKDQLANTIISKSPARPEDVCGYLNGELHQRVCLLDGRMGARLAQETLEESDFRGERFKSFKETDAAGKPISLQGNSEMLVLTKASLIGDIHKEYLEAGSDIIRTHTFGCNALTQREYKMDKLVYEMNKSAAQLAKRATAEVTKANPKKPRFVAGVIGASPCMMSLTPSADWSEMVESYNEQIKGLVEGGVDILILDGVTDALNAKAAIFAIDAFFAKTNKKRIPLMIGAHIAASGRTPAGQSAEAFCISVQYSKPLALGISSTQAPGPMRTHYQPLADLHLGWCIATPSVAGDDPEKFASTVMDDAQEGLLNIVGGDAGALPSHIAALAKRFEDASARRLPGRPHAACLQLCGLDACLVKPEEGFQVVGSRSTVMGSAAFKRNVSAYKATRQRKHLQEAMQVCIEQCGNGADILDFNLDSDLSSGPACPARGVMSSFLQMASAEPRVAKVPFMLCSCQWDTIREGLKCVQGKCIVNGVALALGEDEFLRIAKECQSFGAALVVLAITDEGEPAEKYDDKVRICQQSYKLLRSRLDFPAEDIILDCQTLLLGLPEFASRTAHFIKAVAELKRTCPGASFIGGVNNISLPFRGLNMLRDALHSVFLYHAVPKGLNLAMAWPGALPLYSEIDAETRTLCEEMILNASADGKHLERFNAFVNFRSNSLACLPVQHFGSSMRTEDAQGDWAKPPAVQKEAHEAQRELMAQRRVVPPNQQKSFLKSLRCNISSSAQLVKAEAGAGLADIVRVQGSLDRNGLVNTIVAKGAVRRDDLGRYFNGELRTRVCVMAAPGQEKQLGELDYKEYFSAGCDVCGTSTLQATSYDENRRAAQMAKSAAADVTRKDSQKPRFVAGVIGPTSHALSSSPSADDPSRRSATWDELVMVYTEQIRGLVDGGADLLALEGVSDTLNAKAAIFAIDAYFEQTDKERLPLLITAVIADNGKMPSGQSVEAFLISIKHAKPMSVGISGVVGEGDLQKVSKALSDLSLSWCHISASIGSGESADVLASSLASLAGDKLVNIIGARGASAPQMAAVAGKVASASPRALPAVPRAPALQLSGLEAYFVKPDDSCHMVGQRCSMGGSKTFKGFIDAYKYTKMGNAWEGARDLCGVQCEAGADILDFNFDSELTDSKWAMGNFMRLCATDAKVAKVPFILSSMKWPVIEEGLRSVQGKSIVNAISLVQGEEAFLQMAKACQRYGAAVIVMTVDTPDEFPSFQEKVRIGQKAYKLLRTRLDFPAEDIIFDCNIRPMGSQESTKDFMDAVAEIKRTCPLVSFIGGGSNLSLPYRSVPPLRQALHSVFLYHAIPMGLNLAIVDPGVLPRYSDIEAQTRRVCEEAILHGQADASAMDDLESYAALLSGAAADEIPTALVAAYDMPAAIPLRLRSSPGFTQKIEALVQATGTLNASIFQTFGSKSHACLAFHRNMSALAVKRSVWFSSISVWMGQGGSGPVTGCSCLMDGCALHQRWQQLGNVGVAVEWGAIGEIGVRRTVYGSRDVFAQFDLGQKLISPADTQRLMRVVCTGGPDPYEVVGMAYLDQTWQMTLAGVSSGGALERKSFADM